MGYTTKELLTWQNHDVNPGHRITDTMTQWWHWPLGLLVSLSSSDSESSTDWPAECVALLSGVQGSDGGAGWGRLVSRILNTRKQGYIPVSLPTLLMRSGSDLSSLHYHTEALYCQYSYGKDYICSY